MSRASSQLMGTNLPSRRTRGDVSRSCPRRSRTQRRPLWQMNPRVYGLSFLPSSSKRRPSLQVATMPHESGQSYAHTLRYLPSASIGSSTVQGTDSIPENQVDEGDDVARRRFVENVTLRDSPSPFFAGEGRFPRAFLFKTPEPCCPRRRVYSPSISFQCPRVFQFNTRGASEGRSEGSFCPKTVTVSQEPRTPGCDDRGFMTSFRKENYVSLTSISPLPVWTESSTVARPTGIRCRWTSTSTSGPLTLASPDRVSTSTMTSCWSSSARTSPLVVFKRALLWTVTLSRLTSPLKLRTSVSFRTVLRTATSPEYDLSMPRTVEFRMSRSPDLLMTSPFTRHLSM